MKQLSLLLVCIALMLTSCKKPQSAKTTVIGWWTPYYFMPEQLNGKVKSVKEQNYWASIKDGNSLRVDSSLPPTESTLDGQTISMSYLMKTDKFKNAITPMTMVS